MKRKFTEICHRWSIAFYLMTILMQLLITKLTFLKRNTYIYVPVPTIDETLMGKTLSSWLLYKNTGCPGSKFPNSNSFCSEIMEVRPQVGKVKMCFRNIHFCLHLELFVYNKFKDMKYELIFQHCFHGLMHTWTSI